ncbi:unnamed protein product [Prorocentrum cordatum]|uniref:Uncharacterized protein n=1 Tax=Prorocentrum cordatum TaxID=2364126 RepID=A0ABN9XCG0_9DINO|nr:unnamed protein product [Polarella glacialis]
MSFAPCSPAAIRLTSLGADSTLLMAIRQPCQEEEEEEEEEEEDGGGEDRAGGRSSAYHAVRERKHGRPFPCSVPLTTAGGEHAAQGFALAPGPIHRAQKRERESCSALNGSRNG